MSRMSDGRGLSEKLGDRVRLPKGLRVYELNDVYKTFMCVGERLYSSGARK